MHEYDEMARCLNSLLVFCMQRQPQLFPQILTVQWLIRASGSYSRAARSLAAQIENSDLEDVEMCRTLNERIMTVRPSSICIFHIA